VVRQRTHRFTRKPTEPIGVIALVTIVVALIFRVVTGTAILVVRAAFILVVSAVV
jgi:hypothetical protein